MEKVRICILELPVKALGDRLHIEAKVRRGVPDDSQVQFCSVGYTVVLLTEMCQRAEGEKIQGCLESAGDAWTALRMAAPHRPRAKLKGRNQVLNPSYLAARVPFPSTFLC